MLFTTTDMFLKCAVFVLILKSNWGHGISAFGYCLYLRVVFEILGSFSKTFHSLQSCSMLACSTKEDFLKHSRYLFDDSLIISVSGMYPAILFIIIIKHLDNWLCSLDVSWQPVRLYSIYIWTLNELVCEYHIHKDWTSQFLMPRTGLVFIVYHPQLSVPLQFRLPLSTPPFLAFSNAKLVIGMPRLRLRMGIYSYTHII